MHAELINLRGLPPDEQQRIEAEFIDHLARAFGGVAGAAAAYETWLAAKAQSGPAPVEIVVRRIKWESVFDKVSCEVLAQLPQAGGDAFFVVHLNEKRRPGRR